MPIFILGSERRIPTFWSFMYYFWYWMKTHFQCEAMKKTKWRESILFPFSLGKIKKLLGKINPDSDHNSQFNPDSWTTMVSEWLPLYTGFKNYEIGGLRIILEEDLALTTSGRLIINFDWFRTRPFSMRRGWAKEITGKQFSFLNQDLPCGGSLSWEWKFNRKAFMPVGFWGIPLSKIELNQEVSGFYEGELVFV